MGHTTARREVPGGDFSGQQQNMSGSRNPGHQCPANLHAESAWPLDHDEALKRGLSFFLD